MTTMKYVFFSYCPLSIAVFFSVFLVLKNMSVYTTNNLYKHASEWDGPLTFFTTNDHLIYSVDGILDGFVSTTFTFWNKKKRELN